MNIDKFKAIQKELKIKLDSAMMIGHASLPAFLCAEVFSLYIFKKFDLPVMNENKIGLGGVTMLGEAVIPCVVAMGFYVKSIKEKFFLKRIENILDMNKKIAFLEKKILKMLLI